MLPLQSFKDHISSHELFSGAQKILLAVSGGKDSVLMAHLFKQSGYIFGIAHCNFGLRGDESQRDENFVRMLAAILEVSFHVTHFETKAYASANKISTQMAARALRYEWFEEIRVAGGYTAVALAQHQDDVIETILLNLTRGTGIAGLHGILPKREYLVRPMLFLSRSDIDRIIEDGDYDYVEDSSNLTSNYARNKIRHHVVPHLREINPNLEHTFQQNVQRFAETEQVLQNTISIIRQKIFIQKENGLHISVREIKALRPQHLLLFELLRPFGFSESVIAELLRSLNKQSGTSFYSSTHRIVLNREDLILCPSGIPQDEPVNFIHQHDHQIILSHHILQITYSEQVFFEKIHSKAFVDAGKLIYPLIVRTRQPGDKFRPLGMKTFKKLSDFFIDQKVFIGVKDTTPLIINGNGEVIWIGGLRQDDRYKVTAATKRMVVFDLQPSIYIS